MPSNKRKSFLGTFYHQRAVRDHFYKKGILFVSILGLILQVYYEVYFFEIPKQQKTESTTFGQQIWGVFSNESVC